MLKVSGLSKRVATAHGDLTILQDIGLTINRGESVAVVGASGSGKSTLLGLMAGLDTPTTGTVSINGTDITRLDEDGRAGFRARHIGFVFQAFHLLPTLTALENIALPLELKGETSAFQQAEKLLADIGLFERATHYPRQLSGGEQQRVAIARGFAASPDLLFADEPTGNLDTRTGSHVIDLLFDLNSRSATTLVLVTHDAALAERCNRVIELEAGRIVKDS
ncbi:MAG TPA: ABC transporter ATP-binding protein [Gammaproteobacteria bacterium]|nr:ABC transporter ATP-binding protein [Gammaproteobacteria bacterium]